MPARSSGGLDELHAADADLTEHGLYRLGNVSANTLTSYKPGWDDHHNRTLLARTDPFVRGPSGEPWALGHEKPELS